MNEKLEAVLNLIEKGDDFSLNDLRKISEAISVSEIEFLAERKLVEEDLQWIKNEFSMLEIEERQCGNEFILLLFDEPDAEEYTREFEAMTWRAIRTAFERVSCLEHKARRRRVNFKRVAKLASKVKCPGCKASISYEILAFMGDGKTWDKKYTICSCGNMSTRPWPVSELLGVIHINGAPTYKLEYNSVMGTEIIPSKMNVRRFIDSKLADFSVEFVSA